MPNNPPVTTCLILWLTAETGVTKDGFNRVSKWTDAFNGSLYADQNTAAARPLWVADAFPGYPGIRFNGSQSLFIETSDMGQSNFTVIAVGRATAQRTSGGTVQAGQRFLFCHDFTSAFPSVSVGSNGVGIYEFGRSPALRAEAVTDAGTLCPLTIRYISAAPSAYLDGILLCEGSAAAGATPSIPHGIGGAGTGDGFVGDVAEILIYNGSLTDQQCQTVEAYLQAKYDCYGGSSGSSEGSQSSESSGSSGDGGGGSSGSGSESGSSSDSSGESSGSGDSSGSEPSESSESDDSSSSGSESSSSSSDGPSLHFDENPVYVDWNDNDYDASENLATNCDPITWTIDANGAEINDDGVVTFGDNGEETTVTATSNPYDSMTLTIIKAEVQKVEFTSAHTGGDGSLLIDYDSDFAGSDGSPFDFRGWVKPDENDAEGKNYPITHTQGTSVSVVVTIKVEPSGLNFVVSGTSDVTGLSFSGQSETSTGDAQEITLTSDDALESKIQTISDININWSLNVQEYDISAGTSGPHKIFATWSNPVTDVDVDQPPEPGNDEVPTINYDNKLTLKRARWICEKTSGATTEKEVVDRLYEAIADAAKPHGSLENSWSILDEQIADCDDHARLLIFGCALHGITAISAKYIFASRVDDCTFPDTQDKLEGGLTVRRWLFLKPNGVNDPRGFDNYQGVAFYEDAYYSITPKFKVDKPIDALKKLHENGYADSQEWVRILPWQLIPWKGQQAGEWTLEGNAPFPWEE